MACPLPTELQDLTNKSNVFPNPLSANRIATLISHDPKNVPLAEKSIKSVRPVIHQRVYDSLPGLHQHMMTHDNPEVKTVYSTRGSEQAIISRLLQHRPVVFFTEEDQWTCLDKQSGKGWRVGELNAQGPSVATHMTYDEIKFAALVGLSSFSIFINDGRRDNNGVPDAPGTFVNWGVIIGAVGARFEIPGRMDWEECIVTPQLSVEANGYGANADPNDRLTKWRRLWAGMYELPHLPTWHEALQDNTGRFKQLPNQYSPGGALLDTRVYLKRMRMQAEVLLLEASDRGTAEGRKVYLHVVGLGLGVWQISDDQNILFGRAWTEAINGLNLPNIAAVDFSWINNVNRGFVQNTTSTQVIASKRSPHALIDPSLLLVEIFAWDGNSFPGNEYWLNQLAVSGDPAAAASSLIGEVHNPVLNPRVCGDTVQVHPTVDKCVDKYLNEFKRNRQQEMHLLMEIQRMKGILDSKEMDLRELPELRTQVQHNFVQLKACEGQLREAHAHIFRMQEQLQQVTQERDRANLERQDALEKQPQECQCKLRYGEADQTGAHSPQGIMEEAKQTIDLNNQAIAEITAIHVPLPRPCSGNI